MSSCCMILTSVSLLSSTPVNIYIGKMHAWKFSIVRPRSNWRRLKAEEQCKKGKV
ncbi:hypothetical protein SCLCIDRAFT_1213643 [Scleroderma citrinum Foug A]|uniref:Uncharacterized protein n=1 Tax=Scleroderma citrinum Foug A TaxID=1036808 RepID=A0A0C3E5Z1_9AGAM|nr:hypothetical protein SCLCIDRAFT_1213643 [Scleroderma citrinum Foug A]